MQGQANKTPRLFTVQIPLRGQYEITQLRDVQIGSFFGMQKDVTNIGLRIPGTHEITNDAPTNTNSPIYLTTAQLANLAITLKDNKGNTRYKNLPLQALVIDGSQQIKRAPWYEIDAVIDWSKSTLQVINPIAAPANGFYLLNIQVVYTQ